MGPGSEGWWRRVRASTLFTLGIGGYVTAYFSSADLLDKFHLSDDIQKKLAVLYIIALSVAFLVFLVYRFWIADRKEKFANITPTLHSIVSNCKDLQSDLMARQFADGDKPNRRETEQLLKDGQRRLREICDGVAHVFAMLTSTHCRAAIKVITVGGDGQPYVLTLARDSATHQRHPFLDQKRFEQRTDPLEGNSQFMRLADDDDPMHAFFSNDLSRERNFRCTSIEAYKMENDRRRPLLERIQSDPWLLPYRSTITVTIRNSPEAVAPEEPCVVGFLAVDSESRGVFNSRWDPHLCFLVADALFHPVNYLLALSPDDDSGDQVEAA